MVRDVDALDLLALLASGKWLGWGLRDEGGARKKA